MYPVPRYREVTFDRAPGSLGRASRTVGRSPADGMIAAVQDLAPMSSKEGSCASEEGSCALSGQQNARLPPLCGVINIKGAPQNLRGSVTARHTAARLLQEGGGDTAPLRLGHPVANPRDHRSTRPAPDPVANFSTSSASARLKSPGMVCFKQEAATANSSAARVSVFVRSP